MLNYYTVAIIALLGAMYPGPDFVIVAKHAMLKNRRHGMMASLGIGVGMLIHSAYCILGLALFIARSPALFHFIKYLGASYFILIGLHDLYKKKRHQLNTLVNEKKWARQFAWQAFQDGLVTNVLNPSCTLFMLSLFTLIIRLNDSKLFQIMNGVEIAFISMLWFIVLSYGLTLALVRRQVEKMQAIVAKVIAVVLLMFGVSLLIGLY